jgi:agmatinase
LQVGIRDYCDEEYTFIKESNNRVVTYFDQQIKERQYEGETWRMITDEIINNLPEKIYLSFDIDGLDPKLCPNTGTPVPGGFETEQIFYLVRKLIESGRTLIGLDIVEVGVGDNSIDTSVGARALWRLSNLFIKSNS